MYSTKLGHPFNTIPEYPLSEKALKKFLDLLKSNKTLKTRITAYHQNLKATDDKGIYSKEIKKFLSHITYDLYKKNINYILSENRTERAKIAFGGPPEYWLDLIHEYWLEAAKEMTNFEKTLAGWTKI